jgi:hypothetical protein
MLNLPSYSGAALLVLLLGDLLMLALFALASGPVFLHARDAFGRPLEAVGLFKRGVLILATIGFAGYLALQIALIWSFAPYFFDSDSTATELVTARTAYPNAEHPLALWITTETHRFGVTKAIFSQLSVGQLVEFRFRPLDDTLYEINIVPHSMPTSSPAASPTYSPVAP